MNTSIVMELTGGSNPKLVSPRLWIHISTLAVVLILQIVLSPQSSAAQPHCNLEPEDPNLFVKDVHGAPTPLRNNTPYAIKNVETDHVFVHLSKEIQLLKLSHWWELIFERSPNIYRLRNVDSNLSNKMPLLIRTVQIRQTGPDTYSLHPTSCSGKTGNTDLPSWIYFDFIDDNGKDQVDCEIYHESNGTNKWGREKYQYTFTSVGKLLSSEDLNLEETYTEISNDPAQHLELSTSPNVHSKLLRSAVIRNCGSGSVEQEVTFTTETAVLSRLSVQDTFGVSTNSRLNARVGSGGGGRVYGLFDFGAGVTKAWSEEKVENSFQHGEKSFAQEQSIVMEIKEKVRVGNHSCLRVDANSAFLEDFPLSVLLEVQLQLVRNSTKDDTRFKRQLVQEDDADKFLNLMKFSGKRFTYNSSSRTINYFKIGKVTLTSMISMETKIQQVVCDCKN